MLDYAQRWTAAPIDWRSVEETVHVDMVLVTVMALDDILLSLTIVAEEEGKRLRMPGSTVV